MQSYFEKKESKHLLSGLF